MTKQKALQIICQEFHVSPDSCLDNTITRIEGKTYKLEYGYSWIVLLDKEDNEVYSFTIEHDTNLGNIFKELE